MGSGLSMASVNKIKELAEQREYSLALDIVDSQDLSRSLNPQFLRVCGEIYTKNERYADARKTLVMAHRLAPEGKRVIYSLTHLYLLMGYRDLAKQYYDIYMFDADEGQEETNQIKYIFAKACGATLEELQPLLHPHYLHNLDYDWSFEAFLLLTIAEKNDEADILASDFLATYKNSEYSRIIEDIKDGKDDAKKYFDVFSADVCQDEDPEQEDIRIEEAKLLEADDLRIHPREAEITIMVDDYDEVEIGTKRKLKKFLKAQEKQKKEESMSEETTAEVSEDVSDDVEPNVEIVDSNEESTDEAESGVEKKKGLFKRVFSKKKKESEEVDAETEENSAEEKPDETESEETQVEIEDSEGTEEEAEVITDSEETEKEVESVSEMSEEVTEVSDNEEVGEEVSATEETDEEVSADVESEDVEKDEVQMREIHTNKHNPIISVDLDDNDFVAESDTIEGLNDEEFTNPFDSISALKKDNEEPTFIQKRKTEFVFDDIDLSQDEEDEEFEVDDFTSSGDDEFGEMKSYLDEIFEKTDAVEDETEDAEAYEESSDIEEEVEAVEEIAEELPEELPSVEEETDSYEQTYTEVSDGTELVESADEFETEVETEEDEFVESTDEFETEVETEEDEFVESTDEFETEVETEEDEFVESTDEFAAEFEIEEDMDVEDEAEYTEVYEESSDMEEEVETAEEIVEELPEELPSVEETDSYEEIYPEVSDETDTHTETQEGVKEPAKKSIDYPVFRSSLFPNYHKEVTAVENNFEEIMTAAQDKIQENLLKEEQMQREAEALLASLGIDLGSVSVTSSSMENIDNTLFNEPSRDELKASLKIDSVKKNILRKLKEYR